MRTLQLEDEIAGIGAALGAAYGGALGGHHHVGSGDRAEVRDDRPGRRHRAAPDRHRRAARRARRPGCRPRPSSPTSCRRCSVATARRRCRSSRPSRPADCFDAAMEAARIATTYRTPVMLLSDGYLANGSEPWRVPDCGGPARPAGRRSPPSPTTPWTDGTEVFWPFKRDPQTLARPWAIPGTPGLEHRIGGIEKADGTGAISYDPDNHDRMVRLRQAKVDGIAATIPRWRSTTPPATRACWCWAGARPTARSRAACEIIRSEGGQVARAHLRHLNPFPANTGEILRALRPRPDPGDEPRAAADADPRQVPRRRRQGYNQVRGLPFKATELADQIRELL